MILYHGSNVAFKSIDLAKGMPSKDFGRGFYATDSLDCAEKTARQRVARLGGLPKVMVYGAMPKQDEDIILLYGVRT